MECFNKNYLEDELKKLYEAFKFAKEPCSRSDLNFENNQRNAYFFRVLPIIQNINVIFNQVPIYQIKKYTDIIEIGNKLPDFQILKNLILLTKTGLEILDYSCSNFSSVAELPQDTIVPLKKNYNLVCKYENIKHISVMLNKKLFDDVKSFIQRHENKISKWCDPETLIIAISEMKIKNENTTKKTSENKTVENMDDTRKKYSELESKYVYKCEEYKTLVESHQTLKDSFKQLQEKYNNKVEAYTIYKEETKKIIEENKELCEKLMEENKKLRKKNSKETKII